MRVVQAPAIGSPDAGQTAALMAAIHELSAENNRLKAQNGKIQVKQVIVDRPVDNPVLLERLAEKEKQIEALEKARLGHVGAVRSATRIEYVPTDRIVDRVVEKVPSWLVYAIIAGGVSLLGIGVMVGRYVGKP